MLVDFPEMTVYACALTRSNGVAMTQETVTQETEAEPASGPLVMDPETARNPQPAYKMLRDAAPIVRTERAGVVVSKRSDVEQVLHQPDIFSSAMQPPRSGMYGRSSRCRSTRPITRSTARSSTRSSPPSGWPLLEEPITELVNGSSTASSISDEIDFAAQFSIPFPSQVFLDDPRAAARRAAARSSR